MSAVLLPASERILHFLWEQQVLPHGQLITQDRESVQVGYKGNYNRDAGPDFREARLKIGKMEWSGSVEIHIRSSDWLHHGHHMDPAYDHTVLHVVWNNDKEIRRRDGSILPTIELGSFTSKDQLERHHDLLLSGSEIPCGPALRDVDKLITRSMLERCSIEKLSQKCTELKRLLRFTKGDWDRITWIWIARHYGFRVNNDIMEHLAKTIPYRLLLKAVADNKLEALLFGWAGFLAGRSADEHSSRLRTDYEWFLRKHRIQNRDRALNWRFMRMRPANFPTFRIAQLAALFNRHTRLFRHIREATSVQELVNLFSVPASPYWNHHYRFHQEAPEHSNIPGRQSIHSVIINAAVPLLYFYGKELALENIQERALDLLQQIPPENNRLTRKFRDLGMEMDSALSSQGAFQLATSYCYDKKCLECKIGTNILRN